MVAKDIALSILKPKSQGQPYYMTDAPSIEEISDVLDLLSDGQLLVIDCQGHGDPDGIRIESLSLWLCECEFKEIIYGYSKKDKRLFFAGIFEKTI